MSFSEAVRSGFSNYARFRGRARRSEYWFFTLFLWILSFVSASVSLLIETPWISVILSLAVLLPAIAVNVRRLHDTGRSGWYYLVRLVPVLGLILTLIWLCTDSEPGTNTYGPNPKTGSSPEAEALRNAQPVSTGRPKKWISIISGIAVILAVFLLGLFVVSRGIFSNPRTQNNGAIENFFGASNQTLYRVDETRALIQRLDADLLAIIATCETKEWVQNVDFAIYDNTRIAETIYVSSTLFPESEEVRRLQDRHNDFIEKGQVFIEMLNQGTTSDELLREYETTLAPMFESMEQVAQDTYEDLCSGRRYQNSALCQLAAAEFYLMSMRRNLMRICVTRDGSDLNRSMEMAAECMAELDERLMMFDPGQAAEPDQLSSALHESGTSFIREVSDKAPGYDRYVFYLECMNQDVLHMHDHLTDLIDAQFS